MDISKRGVFIDLYTICLEISLPSPPPLSLSIFFALSIYYIIYLKGCLIDANAVVTLQPVIGWKVTEFSHSCQSFNYNLVRYI